MNVLVFEKKSRKFPPVFRFDGCLPCVKRNVAWATDGEDYANGREGERKNIAILQIYDP